MFGHHKKCVFPPNLTNLNPFIPSFAPHPPPPPPPHFPNIELGVGDYPLLIITNTAGDTVVIV